MPLALFAVRFSLLVAAILATTTLVPCSAHAAGPNAVMTPTGYNTSSVARGDDTSNLIVNLPFTMNWNGMNFTQIYINMNGNATFGGAYTGYNPSTTLAGTNQNIMAPFWADVDTRNTATSQVTYSSTSGTIPTVNGRNAFFVNWINVARYNNQSTPTNSFQLVLVDRSDTGAGNFDFIFNYDEITWDIGTAASSHKARAGWGRSGTGFELPGSGVTGTSTLLDSSAAGTSLIQNLQNDDGQLGRYTFQVRNGQTPNMSPVISVTNRVLEGNAMNSYVGYQGTGDANALDFDGTVASLTHNRPTTLPMGTTNVTWTATDDRGAVKTAIQTIVVTDTIAPANPTLTVPSHVTGVWSGVNTVSTLSTGSTDVCTGVRGLSYAWTRDTTLTPDTILDASVTTTTTVTTPVSVLQSFDTNVWPSPWIRSDAAYVGPTNAAGRNHGTYAVQIDTNGSGNRYLNYFERTYDLTDYTDATLAFWDIYNGSNGDYAGVEYSLNGGASFTTLQNRTSDSLTWAQQSYSLPVGSQVLVRFSCSINRNTEYAVFDDIQVSGTISTSGSTVGHANTTTLADGTWYFDLRAMDNAGNWSTTQSRGPYLIDTAPPVTTDDASAGWSTTPVTVKLTATDGGVVAYTRYNVNGSEATTYTAPFLISTQGTSTISYWSADMAGFSETTKTATVRVDTGAPTVPGSAAAGAVSTSSIEVTWTASTDAVSGLAGYRVYRDGVVVATTSGLAFTDTGLTPGQSYSYQIAALDMAGNVSTRTAAIDVQPPSAQIWLEISESDVNMGSMDPGAMSTVPSATVVTVGGVGSLSYNLDCLGYNFINANPLSTTPVMPVALLGFSTRGWTTTPSAQFATASTRLNTSVGTKYVWRHSYVFDYSLSVPFSYEPGTYTASITYTAIVN